MTEIIDWASSRGVVGYPEAVNAMERRVAAIIKGTAAELVWLLEHPPLYTAGTSAQPHDLLLPDSLPVFRTGRGGQYTYHGPGQRVAYVMLNLARRNPDVRLFVRNLQTLIIRTLASFGVTGQARHRRVGVWVVRENGPAGVDDKIAAIGVRLRKWVSFHGISINVNPELDHYSGIVPCGIAEHGVTSLARLGVDASLDDVDSALRENFEKIFGATIEAAAPIETSAVSRPV